MNCSYSVYGLGIDVNVPIAGLAGLRAPRQVDVRILLGSMPPFLAAVPRDAWRECYVSSDLDERGEPDVRVERLFGGEYFRLAYLDGTVIVVDAQGSRVWATWPESASMEDAEIHVLGPALGLVLRLRGTTCLHASAIAIAGGAAALVGPSGSGKSATAAAFARLGYPVLTDDVLALVDRGSCFEVQPAYPHLRLWPQSVEALFGSVDALPRITPGWDKRFLDLNGPRYRFQHQPLPLAAVYFLDDRSADPVVPRIETVRASQGLMSLVANTYATNLLDKPMRAQEFDLLGRLVESVQLKWVTPSADFRRIPELCDLITDDCSQLASCASA